MILFETPGPVNTEQTLKASLDIARQRNITKIITPSSSGKTAFALIDAAQGLNLTLGCISHVYGFGKDRTSGNNMPEDVRAQLTAKGVAVITAAHALSGAERSLSSHFGGVYPTEIIAHTLRMLGQGTKVAVEIAAMACDAGFAEPGESIIALGGSGKGVDTAIILRPQPSHRILDTRIDEILAKPLVP